MEPIVVTPETYARRVRAMLNPGWSGGLPRRRQDLMILLHALARRFEAQDRLREKEATARIQDFLLGPGHQLGTDSVTLRRALVDEGFVDRESNGTDYRRSHRFEGRVRFEGDMPSIEDSLGAP